MPNSYRVNFFLSLRCTNEQIPHSETLLLQNNTDKQFDLQEINETAQTKQ